ncbi:MAG: hypothetical protein HOP02_03600 [Methylococcaceae bacterium]|nr:hypothetical protein [Methylococcaceae bacterium]
MKKLTLVFFIVTIFIILFFSFAPEDRINLVSVFYKRMINDPGQLCFDLRAKNLKDIESSRIINAVTNDQKVIVTYKSKNGFSGYEKDNFKCELSNGSFDKEKTILEDYRTAYSEVSEALNDARKNMIQALNYSGNTVQKRVETYLKAPADMSTLESSLYQVREAESDRLIADGEKQLNETRANFEKVNTKYEIIKNEYNEAEDIYNKTHNK